jgi:hypothetical protein
VLIWRDLELKIESVVPDFLHIIEVLYFTMLDGVRDVENISLLLSLFTNVLVPALTRVEIFDIHVSSYYRREDAFGGIFSGETGFYDA